MPETSVIIPAYNAARFLDDALDSVAAQTYRDFETIVVDDGSTDGTRALVARHPHPVRYIHQPNQGVSAARNCGIDASRGRLVAFLDADDVWLPGKLSVQVEALRRRDPGGGACYTDFTTVSEDLQPLETRAVTRSASLLEDLLTSGNVVGTPSTVVCRRDLAMKVGGFDAELSYAADWDLWVRLAAVAEFVHVPQSLVKYRRHRLSMSRRVRVLERDSVRLLEKGFSLDAVPARVKARRRRALARNYLVLAGSYFSAAEYVDFCRCSVRSLALDPGGCAYLTRAFFRVASVHARRRPASAQTGR